MATSIIECQAGVEPRRHTLHAGRRRISALEWGGAGQPVLLLHGITSSARTWWRTGAALAQRGHHVYALDMPGHGQSDETDDHRIEALAALVSEAAAPLGLERPHLIGHSWGGAVALARALAPGGEDLASLTLIDPALGMQPERGAAMLPGFLLGVGQPAEQTMPELRQRNPAWHDCDCFWKAEALQQCRLEAVQGLFLHSGDWYLVPRLAEVPVRTLLLVADPSHSVIPPDALAKAERALARRGELRHIPGTDHNMLRGGFDRTFPVLLEWLGRSEGKR